MSSNAGAVVTQNNETHINGKTYVFTWVVKNLNFDLPLTAGKDIMSPPFRTEYGLFKLKLYPGGGDYNNKDFVSVSVCNYSKISHDTRSVISLVNINGEEKFHNSSIICVNSYNVTPVNKFVKRCDITRKFLPNGHLTIKWKLYFYIGVESVESSPRTESMQNLTETRRLAELDDFGILLNDSRFSDIKVVVGSRIFYAHKNILAARSRYFAAMFEPDMKEMKEAEIRITDISADIMQEILRFIYTGKISMEQTMITNLLIIADMYELAGLKTICEEEIMINVSLENIEIILSLLDRVSDVEKLKKSAIEFLMKNAREISEKETFTKTLKSLSSSLMAEVMNTMMSKM